MRKINNKGYFAIGIYHVLNGINVGTLWRTANIFGADFIFTIGKRYKQQASDTMKTPRHVPLFEFQSFADFRDNLPKYHRLVAIEINNNAVELQKFVHPKQAIYLLGAEDIGIPKNIIDECNYIIKLPGTHCLNVSTTGSIVMYDRLSKMSI